jgi:hypothetical protein
MHGRTRETEKSTAPADRLPVGPFVVMLGVASLFLHFAWEMWQVPFFVGMEATAHGQVVWLCTRATFGDVGIALAALAPLLWPGVGVRRLIALQPGALILYVAAGLLVTIAFEFAATEVLGRWAYSSTMPRLPVLGTGVTPILQWIVIPPVAVIFARYVSIGWQYARRN